MGPHLVQSDGRHSPSHTSSPEASPYGYHFLGMSQHAGALVRAQAQVAAVRDDPAARLALMARVFHGPTGRAPRHLPFRRAALSFMRWQARRGVLDPLDASPPGSAWWRAVNERLLRDGCETVALLGGLAGEPSSQAVRLWLEFGARPTGRNWYRAHNASIVGGYLEHRGLADAESAPERFFMNVALVRVLYAHALVAAPRLALGRLAPLGRLVGDPRLGMAGVFLSLRRVLPNRYPLDRDVERYIAEEQRLGRMLDYAVIVPRLQRLYEWSAEELAEPRLLELDSRRQPDLRLAVRGATRVALSAHAVRSPRTCTCHTPIEADARVPCLSCADGRRTSCARDRRVYDEAPVSPDRGDAARGLGRFGERDLVPIRIGDVHVADAVRVRLDWFVLDPLGNEALEERVEPRDGEGDAPRARLRRVRLDKEPGVLVDFPEQSRPRRALSGGRPKSRVYQSMPGVKIGYRDAGEEVGDCAHLRRW